MWYIRSEKTKTPIEDTQENYSSIDGRRSIEGLGLCVYEGRGLTEGRGPGERRGLRPYTGLGLWFIDSTGLQCSDSHGLVRKLLVE